MVVETKRPLECEIQAADEPPCKKQKTEECAPVVCPEAKESPKEDVVMTATPSSRRNVSRSKTPVVCEETPVTAPCEEEAPVVDLTEPAAVVDLTEACDEPPVCEETPSEDPVPVVEESVPAPEPCVAEVPVVEESVPAPEPCKETPVCEEPVAVPCEEPSPTPRSQPPRRLRRSKTLRWLRLRLCPR